MHTYVQGSKGWQCCKNHTLIFEDFLNTPGCAKGKHKFVPEVKVPRFDRFLLTSCLILSSTIYRLLNRKWRRWCGEISIRWAIGSR